MTTDRPPWEELERRGPDFVEVAGVAIRAGSLVRLAPRRSSGGDIFEVALEGRTATVHEVLEDYEGRIQLAVTVDEDPGQDLGVLRRPGHRFFFDPLEVEPLDSSAAESMPAARVLVAGVGNVFLGDDGWGVALASRLAARTLAPGVEVVDFGIRGMDLAYAMQDGYGVVVMLDATPRGELPGTLYVIEPELDQIDMTVDAHGMDPAKVLALARTLGAETLPRTLIVGCEPQNVMSDEEEFIVGQLSEPVQASLDPAVGLVEELLADLTRPEQGKG
ncbi:MAG: hydrogenase maturation protease [Solirubrobacterales bacterium]|jgi:hydrogenase maturation protease|nr:hydrogenase maturation protease [Solirubrobacterales bacterium]